MQKCCGVNFFILLFSFLLFIVFLLFLNFFYVEFNKREELLNIFTLLFFLIAL